LDEQAAVEALVNANTEDNSAPVGEQAATTEQVQQVEGGATETPETETDSFVNIDPATLPPELQQQYKDMQGDYTRKTQEIAPLRSTLKEFGLTADEAREALAFTQALQDPNNLKALYENLSTQFGGAGQTADDEVDDEEFGDPRDKALAELSQKVEGFETRWQRQAAESNLDRLESVVRTDNPHFKDEDMNTVFRLAVSNGGDIIKAAEDYKLLTQRILGAHLQSKAQVPVGAGGPNATGHAETPTKFESVEAAHEAALAALKADFAQQ
jgi:hypothetical protein